MAALATLASTTLLYPCDAAASMITLASVANVAPGMFLWAHPNRELFRVVSLGPTGSTAVNVQRGSEGSTASRHVAAETVFIGRGDQFYQRNPMNLPMPEVLVQPWINTVSGAVFWPVGDDSGPGAQNRTWVKATVTPGIGPLGVRTNVIAPTAAS